MQRTPNLQTSGGKLFEENSQQQPLMEVIIIGCYISLNQNNLKATNNISTCLVLKNFLLKETKTKNNQKPKKKKKKKPSLKRNINNLTKSKNLTSSQQKILHIS